MDWILKKSKKSLDTTYTRDTLRPMRRRNLYLPDALMDDVKKLADRKKIAMADVIRTAIEKYLAAVKKAEEAKQNG